MQILYGKGVWVQDIYMRLFVRKKLDFRHRNENSVLYNASERRHAGWSML